MNPTDDFSTSSVYVDIGLPNAEEMTIKANLVSKILTINSNLGLSEKQIIKILNLSTHEYRDIVRGHFHNIPVETLMNYLTVLQSRSDQL